MKSKNFFRVIVAIAMVSLQQGLFSQEKDTLKIIVKQDTNNYNFKIVPKTNYFVVINADNNKRDSLLTFDDANDVKLLISNLTKPDALKKTPALNQTEIDNISSNLVKKYENQKNTKEEESFFEGDVGPLLPHDCIVWQVSWQENNSNE